MNRVMKKYPNILILNNQSIYNCNATGITLRNILSGWPAENLCELYMDRKAGENDKRNNIHSEYILDVVPVYYLIRKIHNLLNKTKKNHSTVNDVQGAKNVTSQGNMREVINRLIDVSPVCGTIHWEKYLKGFNPDVIYTCGASVSVMKIALKLSRKYNIPIVLHFMDDWAHYLQNESIIGSKWYKGCLQKYLKKCYVKSVSNFAISPYMAEDYEKETGISHIALMNAVDFEKFYNLSQNSGDSIIFTYTGGLHLERWKALKDVETALTKLKQNGYNVKLKIYTGSQEMIPEDYFDNLITEVHEQVPHSEVNKILKEANVLVHVEVQNPILMGFFKYSISTKIPEYMAANRPMLLYAPQNMKLLEYLCENEIAFTAYEKKQLYDTIEEIITDSGKTTRVREKAVQFVQDNYEVKYVREVFYETICKVTQM